MDRQAALLAINNEIISHVTRDALFGAIADALRRVIPFDRTAIFLHDAARDVLRLFVLTSSLPSDYFGVGLEMPSHESHVGWVFTHRQPLLRRDLAREREYPAEDQALADGVRSFVIVPLLARGTAVGTLAVASTKTDQYGDEDVAFLQSAANQVALAVENMKAFEELAALHAQSTATADRYRTLLEITNAVVASLDRDGLFRAVAQALRRVVTFDRMSVFLHDATRDVLRLFLIESSLPVGRHVPGFEITMEDNHVGWVFRQQMGLRRGDIVTEREFGSEERILADGVRSFVVVPLVAHGRGLGTLNVNSVRPNQYSAADAAFLREVADQVALAVVNMLAYEEIASLKGRLERENAYLQEEIHAEHNFVEMVGASPALLAVLRQVALVAPTDSTVLVTGETGTGKELIARALHDRSARRDRPLVKVNCGAIAAGLVESELFGHVKGAFTGALERRIGRFQLADGGTIFLDEVGELPAETQVKLLRVLQEQEFEPVGSSQTLRVNVRVIAATNRSLEVAVKAGRFRADLFYRLNVVPLAVPPLRDRRSDIPQLALLFLTRFARRFGKRVDSIPDGTMRALVDYPWPGNVRELQNIIERAVVLSTERSLVLPEMLGALPPAAPKPEAELGAGGSSVTAGLDAVLERVEREQIEAALKESGGVVDGPRGAAQLLKLHPNTLRSRMDKLGVRRRGPETS